MKTHAVTKALLPLVALAFAGCAAQQTSQNSAAASANDPQSEMIAAKDRKLAELQAELRSKERMLASKDSELAQARSVERNPAPTSNSLFPPNPKPGECYARVLIPAKYKTTSERVLKREASERIEIIPAKYGPGTERVLIKEASTKLVVEPAKYGTVTERVLVSPASRKMVEVPAKYKTVTERVLDKPAHTAWKRGSANLQAGKVLQVSGNEDTGEIMCLVEVPASYKTISKQVLVSPPSTDIMEIPAKYETVTKTVMTEPPTTREVTIPAEYKTIKTTVLLEPARETRIPIPAEYDTVTKTEKVSEERLEWNSVLCDINMTSQNVIALQRALEKTGHYKGPIDGVMGPMTLGAAQAYANSKGMASGSNYVPMRVVSSLGIKL